MRRTFLGIAYWCAVALPVSIVGAQATRPAALLPAPTTAPSTQPFSSTQAVLPPQAATQSAGAATEPVDYEALAKQLSSTDWRERRNARETLIRIGDDAKSLLETLIQSAADEETRHQAQEALVQIEQNRTLGPSYITLHVKDARPEEVFAEISRQCHTPLLPYPDNLWSQGGFPTLTMDVDRKPFWEVAPRVCRQFGVDLRQQYPNGLRLMRTGGNMMSGISEVDGAFLVVANQINYTRSRALGAGRNGETSNFSMNLTVYPEPKITLLHGITNLKIIEAVDDHGNSMLPPVNNRTISSGGFSAGAAQLFAPLTYPRRNPGTKMARFRANATFNVQTKVQQVQIPDVAKVKNFHVPVRGMDITVKDLVAKDNNYELRLSIVQSPNLPPELRNVYELVQNNLRLVDNRGIELPHHGMSSNPRPDGTEITLIFGQTIPAHGPDKLLWDIPLESKPLVVPIQFTDIPLFDN